MKYIMFDSGAIDEIVASRFLQSSEFEQGKEFLNVLAGRDSQFAISANIKVIRSADGLAIVSPDISRDARFLVVDAESADFFKQLNDFEALFAVQKLLRLAKKLWQGLSLTFSEKIISGSSKVVLFPFQYKPTPFRVVIEREPMAERLAKRGGAGKFLLAYKAGYEAGDAVREVAELTNFRKAYDDLPSIKEESRVLAGAAVPNGPKVDQLQVSDLGEANGDATTSIFRSYGDWQPLLTVQQRAFVEAPIIGAHRIEGAAGTGKTLCLMLKAIHALARAESAQEPNHIVFVTHSDATRSSVKEFLSVIDPFNFAERDRSSSNHSLKVCTLSDLCAEQLRQHISESEFIDRDAMESKELQLLYVSEAFEEARTIDLPSHQRFLSPELTTFLRDEDNWKIAEMLQHEISVIIKGRASEDLDKYKKSCRLSMEYRSQQKQTRDLYLQFLRSIRPDWVMLGSSILMTSS
ncbi:UvrD-helicase domain-containing protein [Mesorhizobium sp. M1006]|uniref:UvrD-helicase domain-containing protein n=1 Tax=Mesorhizobium sp. M1006 TaxID=2957048 RepID=UPI00333D870D